MIFEGTKKSIFFGLGLTRAGRSLPSLDNFVILSRLLHTSIEDILVVDGDVVRFRGNSFKLLVQ